MSNQAHKPDFARLGPREGAGLVVVGGSGGIGRALIEAGLECDLRVANLDLAESIAQRPPPQGTRNFAFDAADEDLVLRAFAKLDSEFGEINAMVHLTGFADDPAPIEDTQVERWDEMLAVNLRSAFLCAKAALPLLRKAGGGSIVNTASGLATMVERGLAAYSASKAGIIALTKVLAKENAPLVRANAVAPGPVDTPFLSGGTGRGGTEGATTWFDKMGAKAAIEQSIPFGRIGEPDDVVGPILFLAGDASRYMTGQVLYINGGRLMP